MKNLIFILLSLITTGQVYSQIQTINVGTSANNGAGDPIRTAFQKVNANFTYVDGLIDDNVERLDSLIDAGSGSVSWSDITGEPTTISGYGITDGVTITGAQTLTNKTLTSPVINSPTGIVKGDVGLGSVDNTSDANKPVSTATQTALDLKLNKASTASSGTSIAFDTPRTYGYSADETGNITLNATGLVEGTTQLLIHNHSSEPTFPATMKIIGGTYTINVDNYILLHAVKSDLILVTISQEQ